jgi:hypothetical protein
MKNDWMRLDNAAKIYPAAKSRNWTALFRLSADLTEPVEPGILREALRRTTGRFPHLATRLRRGVFWYYLEKNDGFPEPEEDSCCPCLPLRHEEHRDFCFRVLWYENRIAVEFFHVLTDGTGGMCFLKTLLAEYLSLRYAVSIPRGGDILDCTEAADPEEYEDSFLRHAGNVHASRAEKDSFYIKGKAEPDGFVNLTSGSVPTQILLDKAHEAGVSLTEYLTAVLIMSIYDIQRREVKFRFRRKPIKICVPVNLRRFFPTKTLRNFSSYVNPGIEPKMGQYTFEEALKVVYHQIGSEVTEKQLRAKFTTNVRSEKNPLLRITPLFLKSPVMKLVFYIVGDRKTSSTISNLGNAKLPPEMAEYITGMDFVLGPFSRNPVVCAALSYNGTTKLNFTRTITDSKVEKEFFRRLIKLGIPVLIESNRIWED